LSMFSENRKPDRRLFPGPALTLLQLTPTSLFRGALPWPATLDLGFQREAQEGSDRHDSGKQPHARKRKRGGNGRDNVCTDKELKPQQDAASYIGTVGWISRLPVMRAAAVADKRQCRKDNAANNDDDANELQRLGKLVNVGMNLLGQVPALFDFQPNSCRVATR